MNECFDVCEKADVDIYEVMTEYLQKAVIGVSPKTRLQATSLCTQFC